MRKKVLIILFLITITAILSCGCVSYEQTTAVTESGSGNTVTEIGIEKKYLDKLGKNLDDYLSGDFNIYSTTKNGREYMAFNEWGDAWTTIAEVQSTLVGSMAREWSTTKISAIDGGFNLNIKPFEEIGQGNDYKKLPNFNEISDATLQGMTLTDLVNQGVDGLNLKITFIMPYNVTQTKGVTDGVTIKGNIIYLDCLDMVNSGCKEFNFTSIKTDNLVTNETISINKNFNDVISSKWYYNAINYSLKNGLVNGYASGNFYPSKNLTYAELCKILSKTSATPISNNSEYWAKDYILYAQKQGYILSTAEPTKENFDIPVTREAAIYAITKVTGRTCTNYVVDPNLIVDFDLITPEMRETIMVAYNTGITSGRSNMFFDPKADLTRAEFCQIMYNIKWK